jgi:predicted dehydrogenase
VAEKVEAARARFGAPRGYADYQAMIRTERPDLVCVATRPGPHAETVRFAAEHGVRAIYCEKPLSCSMAEADAMVEACERHGVAFNYGTQRRYVPLFRRLREVIQEGGIGKLEAVVAYCGAGAALWTHTHTADMLQLLAGDAAAELAQGTASIREEQWEGERLTVDPGIASGFVQFETGTRGYLVASGGDEYEARGSEGTLRTLNGGLAVEWRRARAPWRLLEPQPFPESPWESGTVNGIRELVAALDGRGETSGGIRRARASQEIVFGFVASHRQGGARVALPLVERGMEIRPEGW